MLRNFAFSVLFWTLASLCSLSPNALATPLQWAGNGHYYEYVSDRLDWSDALSNAESRTYLGLPGYLATVTSQGENDFIKTLLVNAAWGAWLGGSDAAQEGVWTWIDGPEQGTVFWLGDGNGHPPNGNYTNWGSAAPNNLNIENALGIWGPNGAAGPTDYGIWNDFQGQDTQGFVVEYSAVPEPNSLVLLAIAVGLLFCFQGSFVKKMSRDQYRTSVVGASTNHRPIFLENPTLWT